MTKVLLIEEDIQQTYFIQRNLTINGHIVAAAPSVKFATPMMATFRPDVVVTRLDMQVDTKDIPVVRYDGNHLETIVDDIVKAIAAARSAHV